MPLIIFLMIDGATVGLGVKGVGAGVNVVGSRVIDGAADGATGKSMVPKRKKYTTAAMMKDTTCSSRST